MTRTTAVFADHGFAIAVASARWIATRVAAATEKNDK